MEFIKDQEKRILLSAISREKKVIKEHSELKELIPIIEQLDYYFMYDRLFKSIYNQALEDFNKKMKEVNLTNSFVLYYGDEIDLEEFMNLASDEIKEQLMK